MSESKGFRRLLLSTISVAACLLLLDRQSVARAADKKAEPEPTRKGEEGKERESETTDRGKIDIIDRPTAQKQERGFAKYAKEIERILRKDRKGQVWDGRAFVDLEYKVEDAEVAGQYGGRSWTKKFNSRVLGVQGIMTLTGVTSAGELFDLDTSTGAMKRYLANFTPVLAAYAKLHKDLEAGKVAEARKTITEDVAIVDEKQIQEGGPLNVQAFRDKVRARQAARRYFGFDEKGQVLVMNAWAVFVFKEIRGAWKVVNAYMRPEI